MIRPPAMRADFSSIRTSCVLVLILAAAGARLLLHLAEMPPYSGLDELYHVGRLEFEAQTNRGLRAEEPSLPRYLADAASDAPGAVAAFAERGSEWPSWLHRNRDGATRDVMLTPALLRIAERDNYEYQQPALYYLVARELPDALGASSALSRLMIWRGFSGLLALLTVGVLALGLIRARLPTSSSAALLLLTPTWLTLTVRASNDALACFAITLAIVITWLGYERNAIAEGVAWGVAAATKLYALPLMACIPLFWFQQRTTRRRMLIVGSIIAAALIASTIEVGTRSRNPTGLFAFDPVDGTLGIEHLRLMPWDEVFKTFLLTLGWTSGQHWNALTPVGFVLIVVLYTAPWAIGWVRREWRPDRRGLAVLGAVVVAFAAAQLVNLLGYARSAGPGELPAGGKEGWYWYSMLPLVLIVAASSIRRNHRLFLGMVMVCGLVVDIGLSELALYLDYAGTNCPDVAGLLVRWGRCDSATLSGTSIVLRLAQIVLSFAALFASTAGPRRLETVELKPAGA